MIMHSSLAIIEIFLGLVLANPNLLRSGDLENGLNSDLSDQIVDNSAIIGDADNVESFICVSNVFKNDVLVAKFIDNDFNVNVFRKKTRNCSMKTIKLMSNIKLSSISNA